MARRHPRLPRFLRASELGEEDGAVRERREEVGVQARTDAIAVDEARKLKIPVIGVVDTNCDPDEVDYVVPGNDDALRAIRLFASKIADAVVAGRGMRESRIAEEDAARAEEAAAADSAARLTRAGRPQRRAETPTTAGA